LLEHEYLSVTTDTAGPVAMVLRGLSGDERDAVTGAERRLDSDDLDISKMIEVNILRIDRND
jgi:hypothetical protein